MIKVILVMNFIIFLFVKSNSEILCTVSTVRRLLELHMHLLFLIS